LLRNTYHCQFLLCRKTVVTGCLLKNWKRPLSINTPKTPNGTENGSNINTKWTSGLYPSLHNAGVGGSSPPVATNKHGAYSSSPLITKCQRSALGVHKAVHPSYLFYHPHNRLALPFQFRRQLDGVLAGLGHSTANFPEDKRHGRL
jgi:hypothetical protein